MLTLGSVRWHDMAKSWFEDSEEEENKYHFGSHYSNPGIVIMYLVRIVPFLDADLKF